MTASTQAEHPAIAKALDARVQNELGERWVSVTMKSGATFNFSVLEIIGGSAFMDASGHAHWGNTDFDVAYEGALRQRWFDDAWLTARAKSWSYETILQVGRVGHLQTDVDAAAWAAGDVELRFWGRDG